MLLHFHVAPLPPVVIEVDPVTGETMPPPPPPPPPVHAGFSAEYAFVLASDLQQVNVTLAGDDEDTTVETSVVALRP